MNQPHTPSPNMALSPLPGEPKPDAPPIDALEYWKAGIQEVRTFRGHSHGVWDVACSPDGLTLVSGGADRFLRIWEIETGRLLKSLKGHTNDIRQVAFSPDGQTLATGSDDRTIRLWNPHTGETTRLLFTQYDHAVASLSFSPDGLLLARAGQNKDIKIWEITTGTEVMTLLGKDQYDHHWTVCTAFSPDGIHLVGGSDIGKLKLYEALPSGEERLVHNGHWRDEPDDEETEERGFFVDAQGGFQKPMEYWIGAIAFTPDGKTMMTGSRDASIKYFEMPDMKEAHTIKGHSEWVRGLIVSPDGKLLVSCSDDHTIKMWDIQTKRQVRVIKDHKGPVRGIAFSPDARYLASASWDRTVKFWKGGDSSEG